MSAQIMWVVILVCLIRCLYVSIRDKNWSYILVSVILVVWSAYKVGSLFGLLPAELM
ncbi:MAG: hypothetical protein RR321_07940 [Acidaminococcaceae bacterium]